jgi:AcrR family transcriptional regulator
MAPSNSSLPTPPRRPAATRRASRSGLSVEAIVAAAIALLDESGIERLAMRQVAQRLGVGVASLYGYVSSREELLDLVFDELVGQVPLPEPDPARWREQVFELMSGLRRVLSSHRDAALAGMGRIPTSPNTLRGMETLGAMLRLGGLSDRAIALGFDQLALYVCAHAFEESMFTNVGMTAEDVAQYHRQIDAFFTALPARHFPVVASLAGEINVADGEERFAFGLDVLLSGLEAVSARG